MFESLTNKLTGKQSSSGKEPSQGKKPALRGLDYGAQTDALKPKEGPPEGSKGMAGRVKHFFGMGGKSQKGAPDPAKRAAYEGVIGAMTNLDAFTNNFIGRVPQFQRDSMNSGSPEMAERCAPLASNAAMLSSASDRVFAAFGTFIKNGDDAPLRAAIDTYVRRAVTIRMVLTGLVGPGDSRAANGLLINALGPDKMTGGVVVGPKDAAKGKKVGGKAEAPMASGQLPMGNHVTGQALRVSGEAFVTECDNLRALVDGLG